MFSGEFSAMKRCRGGIGLTGGANERQQLDARLDKLRCQDLLNEDSDLIEIDRTLFRFDRKS